MSDYSISASVEIFRERYKFYRDNKSLPMFFSVLEAALTANADLDYLSRTLPDLFNCDHDQLWASKTSNYYKLNRSALREFGADQYIANDMNTKATLDSVWSIIKNIEVDYISHEWNYLAYDDYITLYRNNETEPTTSFYTASAIPALAPELAQAFTDWSNSDQDLKHSEKDLIKIAQEKGFEFFPSATLTIETDFYNTHLNDFKELSSFIRNKFRTDDKSKKISLSDNNELILLNIFGFILFKTTARYQDFKDKGVAQFLEDRIKYDSELSRENDDISRLDYSLSVINLTMISALLNHSAIASGVLTKDELTLDFIKDYFESYEVVTFKALFVPPRHFSYLLSRLTAEDCVCFDEEFMSAISKGDFIGSANDDEIIERHVNEIILNHSDNLTFTKLLRENSLKNALNWTINLSKLHDLNATIGFNLFNHENDYDYINNALEHFDLTEIDKEKLPLEWLAGEFAIYGNFDENHHVALHSVTFTEGFYPQEVDKWLEFASALLRSGQPFYSCLVIGTFFVGRFVSEEITEQKQQSINPADLSKLLGKLKDFPCFDVALEGMEFYLHNSNYSTEHYGTLKAFSPSNQRTKAVTPVSLNFRNLENPPKNLTPAVIQGMSKLTSETETKFFKAVNISDDIVLLNEFVESVMSHLTVGLEAELKKRMTILDESWISKLEKSGIKFARTTSIHDQSLGTLLTVLQELTKYPSPVLRKLDSLGDLILHQNYKEFKQYAWDILKLRNTFQHSNETKKTDQSKKKGEVKQLIKSAFSGDFIKALIETGRNIRASEHQTIN